MKEYTKQDLANLPSGERGQIIDGDISYVVVGDSVYKLAEIIADLIECSKSKNEKKEEEPKKKKGKK